LLVNEVSSASWASKLALVAAENCSGIVNIDFSFMDQHVPQIGLGMPQLDWHWHGALQQALL
jgi:hypothetical protein